MANHPSVISQGSLASCRAAGESDRANRDDCKLDATISSDRKQLHLSFQLRLCAAGVAWTTEYKATLDALSVAPTDILAAQVRDLQEEVEALKAQLAGEQGATVPVFWSGSLSAAAVKEGSSDVVFTTLASSGEQDFELDEAKQRLVVQLSGVYHLIFSIECNTKYRSTGSLLQNGNTIVTGGYSRPNIMQREIGQAVRHQIVRVEEGDEFEATWVTCVALAGVFMLMRLSK